MGDNAPSAEQVANLEKEQREAELQAEFAEFERNEQERNRKQKVYDEQRAQIEREHAAQKKTEPATKKTFTSIQRKEQERNRKQKEYDKPRAQIEREYAEQKKTEPATKKTFTGIRAIDDYLDKADMSAETRASGKRIQEEREIRKQEAAGKITPEYASFRREKASEKYEKQKVSDVRMIVDTVAGGAKGAVKGASSYQDNGPARGGRKVRATVKRSVGAKKPQPKGFTSGVTGFSGAQFPSFFSGTPQKGKPGQSQMRSYSTSFPSVGVEMPKQKADHVRASKPGFPSGLAQSTSMFGSKVTKSEGIKLNMGSPFGAKKTSPLKKGTQKKSLW
jgi:hypothetical protein